MFIWIKNEIIKCIDSVMQSDENSFGRDVVLGSFNKASRDEDNQKTKDQKYEKHICFYFYHDDFNSL